MTNQSLITLDQELVNTVVQIGVVLIIAALFYFFAGRNRGNFFNFTGIKPTTMGGIRAALIASLILVPLSLAIFYFSPLSDAAAADNTVAGKLQANGLTGETILLIGLIAIFKTSFSEEIFFRGILAKRLISWMGFAVGNTLHALIFGAIHLLIFVFPGGPEFSLPVALGIGGFPALGGWIMAYINEKAGNGSIVPGWIVHALTNLIAYPVLAFA